MVENIDVRTRDTWFQFPGPPFPASVTSEFLNLSSHPENEDNHVTVQGSDEDLVRLV